MQPTTPELCSEEEVLQQTMSDREIIARWGFGNILFMSFDYVLLQNLPKSMIESEVIEGDEELLSNCGTYLDTDIENCDTRVDNVEYPDYLDMNCGSK